MASIPTFSELYNSIISDLKIKFGISSLIGKSFINAFSLVSAAKQKLQYTLIAITEKNIYPDTSDEYNLRRCGRIRLGRDISPAISGEYMITVTGVVGYSIPVNTTFSDKNGFLFNLDSPFTFVDVTGSVRVRALTPGIESKLSISDTLQITSPLSNVDSYAIVTSIYTQPVVAETLEEYRVNIINSYRLLPQGGSRADYRVWTESVSGIREVYPYITSGKAGEIDLFVEAFPADSTDNHGTPTPTELLAVENAIEPDKIPMGVFDIHYLPVDVTPIDININNISDVGKISEITIAITDYLYNIRPYIAGADISSEIYKGKIYSSTIEGIIIDSGVTFNTVTVEVDGNPISNYEFTNGKIPYLNSITHV